MNSSMIRAKIETIDQLISITKNCETLIKRTHTKAPETLEFKMIKPRETVHLNHPNQVDGDLMIGLTDSEVYNSFLTLTEANNKFQLYTNPLDSEFSFTELENKLAEVLDLSHIKPEDLEHETRGPDIINAYRELG